MKQLFILKAGTTFPATAQAFGDFDAWTRAALGPLRMDVRALDVEHGAPLPPPDACAGVVITGSHAMVTDRLPWSVALEHWLPLLIANNTPVFGICYGHQLLAQATGGEVGFHSQGSELGTVEVRRLPESDSDPLFGTLPMTFPAHVAHAQSVLRLPPNAVRLAANRHEATHAFRVGDCAWGVQFHPEYTPGIMGSYIREEAADLGLTPEDVAARLRAVRETSAAEQTLRAFGRLAEARA